MADGELGAVFKGLTEDADQAAGNISESVAKIGEQTADSEEANLGRTLDAEAQNATSFSDIADDGAPAAIVSPAGDTDGGFTGAGHVSSSSPDAEAAYASIRQSTEDVPKIAENTGIGEDVIGQVKNHLFHWPDNPC
jgi:hypothetical protein